LVITRLLADASLRPLLPAHPRAWHRTRRPRAPLRSRLHLALVSRAKLVNMCCATTSIRYRLA
jgi:hypothetical protein